MNEFLVKAIELSKKRDQIQREIDVELRKIPTIKAKDFALEIRGSNSFILKVYKVDGQYVTEYDCHFNFEQICSLTSIFEELGIEI